MSSKVSSRNGTPGSGTSEDAVFGAWLVCAGGVFSLEGDGDFEQEQSVIAAKRTINA